MRNSTGVKTNTNKNTRGENMFEGVKVPVVSSPTLSFGDAGNEPDLPVQEKEESPAVDEGASVLSEEEMQQTMEFAKKIDLSDTKGILGYGSGTQQKMADFSDKVLGSVRNKDLGEIGGMVTQLVTELKNFDVDDNDRGIFRIFKKNANKMNEVKAKYGKVEGSVQDIAKELESHQGNLIRDIELLEQIYGINLTYFKELTMYIIAGKKKLEDVRGTELAQLQETARRTGLTQDAQAAKDLAAQCDRFEKKIYDLQLTRTIAMQTGPQIRMIQNADTMMAEKIQTTVMNTIPLWKNQMVIAIGIEHSSQAARAEREVNDMTNALLKKNAEHLKMATVESAKESERGIVDIETLKYTNEMLISTMDEVLQIQAEGKEKRKAAEAELVSIESQLREKLLQASKS